MKIRPIPQEGIEGEAALREAGASEFRAVIELVGAAVRAVVYPNNPDRWLPVEAIYPDRVVVSKDGRLYAYPYTLNADNRVELGEPTEVVLDHKPVAVRAARGAFLEAQDAAGLKWRIRVIKAGLSGNRNYYPDAVLREAAPLFEGARVFVKSDEEHLEGKGKSFDQLIGRLRNAAFVEGKGTDSGEILADLELLASAGDVPAKLLEAHQRGMSDLFGFSIDVKGTAKMEKSRRVATKITKVNSVDLIIEPGAGGQIINLIEAVNPEVEADMKLRERMIEAVKAANKGALPEGLDINDDEALEVAYREALQNAMTTTSGTEAGTGGKAAGARTTSATPATGVTREELTETVRMVEARANMRVLIAECNLPQAAKDKLRKSFDAMERFTEAQVTEAINDMRDLLGKLTPTGRVQGVGGTSFIEAGEDRGDKVKAMLDDFFVGKVSSFKECYVEITGDRRVTGMLRDCDAARFRESLSDAGNLDVLLGDAIHRRMVADYRDMGQYDVWRNLCTVVPLNDFRTNHRTRLGGYGDLPTVAKGAAYPALTSPSDEEATYAPSKRGGTETIALEDIRNDDVGLIRRIPLKLSRAAKRTLAKFVLDFIKDNPVIYDGTALFTVGHGNLGAAALDATSLAARRLAMLQRTEAGSDDRIGIGPKYLWVPFDLQETAVNLFNRSTNNDKTFIQQLALEVMPVWYWTDANDWALSADPNDIPTIEVGFLDGNEEPELFVQDSPTSGSMFSNDQLTWKIRHIYGGNVLDYRGLDKSVVV